MDEDFQAESESDVAEEYDENHESSGDSDEEMADADGDADEDAQAVGQCNQLSFASFPDNCRKYGVRLCAKHWPEHNNHRRAKLWLTQNYATFSSNKSI